MLQDIADLFDKPLLLFLVLMAGGFTGFAVEQVLAGVRRKAWREQNKRRWPVSFDSADQLRIVMQSDFTAQPLLNKGEARLFRELDRMVLDINPKWQVMAQVSLGEVLNCPDKDAYGCVNSKRVDLLLMDDDCRPRHALEYQGHGHYQKFAAARDAVKKEALRRAGIGYHEVLAGHTTPAELKRLIERLVDKPGAAA